MTPTNRLWTSSFISACIGNFLLFFAFYLLVPIFPLYLIDEHAASKSLIGILLASYTIAALLIRPFAGFVLDMVYRKPIYLAAFFLFVVTFVGYPLANSIGLFLFFRVLHGFTFGFVTTAGNSLIVDVTPAERRGEGLGFFGVANTISMAVGPMTGLYLHDYYSYDVIFYAAIGAGLVGLIFASMIKAENKSLKTSQPVAWDRFFLFKGFNAGFALLLMGIPYGMIVTYIALYGREIGIKSGIGLFFSFMAVGLTISRFFSGRLVDQGKLVPVITWGTALSLLSFVILATLKLIDNNLVVLIIFYIVSLLMGVGYGLIFPAYNTLFVNLAPNNRRATASSTYMTSWDIGIGIGLVSGGWLADSHGGLAMAYLAGGLIAGISLLFFAKMAGPHFDRNKLR
ncbi:MAG: MFS transporter [Paludibacter sp.]